MPDPVINANTVSNVSAGKPKIGGAVFSAPYGSTLPESAAATLDAAFQNMGYMADSGVVNSNSMSSNPLRAWGGDIVLVTQESKDDTFQYTMIEILNTHTLKSVYGSDNVSGALETGISVRANGKELPPRAWVLDMLLRDGAAKRIVIPNGKITAIGDITYADNSLVGYPVTLTALPHAAYGGDTHREYMIRAASSGSGGS